MVERSADWMAQAKRNIEIAKSLRESKVFEWACFLAHQAAELAVKALFQKLSIDAWGHSVHGLMDGLPEGSRPLEELMDLAWELDNA